MGIITKFKAFLRSIVKKRYCHKAKNRKTYLTIRLWIEKDCKKDRIDTLRIEFPTKPLTETEYNELLYWIQSYFLRMPGEKWWQWIYNNAPLTTVYHVRSKVVGDTAFYKHIEAAEAPEDCGNENENQLSKNPVRDKQ